LDTGVLPAAAVTASRSHPFIARRTPICGVRLEQVKIRGRREIVSMEKCKILVTLLVTSGIGAAAAAAQEAPAQPTAPVSYTLEQADSGYVVYEENCVDCHMEDLEGEDESPPLVGPYFASSWGNRPVTTLLSFVKRFMPFMDPGSLTDDQYAAVVAYVLSANGSPTGATPLTMSSTGLVVLNPEE
jgi:mono/diheme cytochrome c family protein